ncbi:hypothetical protein HG536_0C01810 [Torulaspora globosa]|uniref:Uncharacterized protein n=1 Tax=Torulaspora globosa TaxID=48254 RepID=A0A7G3ZES7_9SACH|nr:uncharacterized protein HG536_0C01810 [Torulaspora globosa]QLL32013.1 hypothetical protein HG536_0C01810 [Torulaspora globosa]
MFYTQVLRSAAAAGRSAKAGRIGESWAMLETKRLVPTLLGWGGFCGAVLGWPYAIKYIAERNR